MQTINITDINIIKIDIYTKLLPIFTFTYLPFLFTSGFKKIT